MMSSAQSSVNSQTQGKPPCLVIVFNHPFPANVPVLDAIYRPRFPHIRYLIPFHRDPSNPDIIPVYRGSYVHEGFATDAAHALRNIDCSHFIFMQDDVLLNPRLDAGNILDTLGVGAEDGFINQMGQMNIDVGRWHWILGILWKLFYPRNQLSGTGVDSIETMLAYLPNVEHAREVMRRYGIDLPVVTRTAASLTDEGVIRSIPYFGTSDHNLIIRMNELVVESLFATAPEPDRITLPFPFAMSAWGADFFIVPQSAFETYQHYAGVLAAAGTFAEISVATALALSVKNVVTAAGKPYLFEWIWTPDRENQAADLAQKLDDPGIIAVHPVKISIFRKDKKRFLELFPDLNVN